MEVVMPVLVRGIHFLGAGDQVRIRAVRVGVDRDAVESAVSQGVGDGGLVLDPSHPDHRRPGRRGRRDHLIAGMARKRLDPVPAPDETGDVPVHGDLLLGPVVPGPLARQVRLIPDDPDVGARRGLDVVGDPLREIVIVVVVGERPRRRPVAVVDPDDDAVSLVRPRPEVLPVRVRGISPDPLGEKDPPLLPLLRHVVLAPRLMDAEDIG